MGSAGKAKRPNIGKRLRSIGYQPLKLVTAIEPEQRPKALPASTSAEGDGLEALPENRSSVVGGRKPLPYNESGEQPGLEPLLANEDANSAHRWALLLNEGSDFYLLRDLLWCGLCDEPFAACLMSTGIRYYGCTNVGCPRPLVNAEEAEQVVWQRFSKHNPALAPLVTRTHRQIALSENLKRATVQSGVSEMGFEWRE